jgi:hypothetical protein
MGWFSRTPERREEIVIGLELDAARARKHDAEVRFLSGWDLLCVEQGDTVHIDYKFRIDYFDHVCGKLEAVERIIDDPEVVKRVSVEELEYGRSVIMDVAAKLKSIIEKLG